MRSVKDLVVFKEIWKEAHVSVNEELVELSDGYYALYMLSIPIKTQKNTIYSFKTNPEMFSGVVRDCQVKSVKRFQNEIIEDFEKRFCGEAKIPKLLNYESRTCIDVAACTFNKVDKRMWIVTPVFVKYCDSTDYKEIERLRKEGKISE